MDIEKMRELTDRIKEKLGDENTALISDDLGILLSDNQVMNQDFQTKDEEINKLKKDKENLINTNGKLLQQVSMSVQEVEEKSSKQDYEEISFKDCFDEKGNFI